MAALVLLTNLSLTIWASVTFGVDRDRIGTISKGSCSGTKKLSLWLHLAINALSSVLLSASNYCMQILSAPTRAEIDRQHSKGIWLDIGQPSIRNLRKIKSSRVILWWCFGLSSVPLHLMYNSAVFSTLAANQYYALVVAPEFLDHGPWSYDSSSYSSIASEILANATANRLDQLDRATCLKEYGEFVSARSNVIVVTTAHNSTDSLFSVLYLDSDFSYRICDTVEGCKIPLVSGSLTDIDYCLSQKVDEKCKLQFSLYIMIVVIFCNLVKSVAMFLTVWKKQAQPLVTLGDAVSSFLDNPDAATKGMCLLSKSDILGGAWKRRGALKQYRPVRNFWFRAASLKRWLICNSL
ncbi:MAG: hypothetical protein M1839_003038 [Geoglossum umbratile]|nr:MAG: hypothetical protein M1839_003038 [Geoglossum umbratile]